MAGTAGHFASEFERQRASIDDDRACLECGYALRGLKVGGRCPECGTIIPSRSFRDDPLTLMPIEVIHRFMLGAWVAAGSMLLSVAGFWGAFFELVSWRAAWGVVAFLPVVWIGATFLLTPSFNMYEAASRGFSHRSRLRMIGRTAQFAWLVPGALLGVRAFGWSAPAGVLDLLHVLASISVLVGLGGMIVLAVLFRRLAEWVRDDNAEWMFNWFAWVSIPAILVTNSMSSMGMLAPILGIGTMIVLGFFPLGLLNLTKSITLSWQHHHEHTSREERRARRRARDQSRFDGRIRSVDGASPLPRKPPRRTH